MTFQFHLHKQDHNERNVFHRLQWLTVAHYFRERSRQNLLVIWLQNNEQNDFIWQSVSNNGKDIQAVVKSKELCA